jgi:hypothetical protein
MKNVTTIKSHERHNIFWKIVLGKTLERKPVQHICGFIIIAVVDIEISYRENQPIIIFEETQQFSSQHMYNYSPIQATL